MKLVVGPGIIEKYMPGWPTVPKAEFHLADVEYGTRPVVELSKDMFTLDVGGLRAYDYFEDGSFYVLDAPGVCYPLYERLYDR